MDVGGRGFVGLRPWPWWRCAITGLSVLALVLSAYLGWHYLVGGTVIGCAVGSSCDQVLGSRWSTIGGVLPVSGLAEGVYLAILVASFFIGPDTEAPVHRLAWRALLVLAGAVAGSALWFTFLQKWIIGAFCPYCMATHLTGLTLAMVIFWWAPWQSNDEANAVAPAKSPSSAWPALGLTLAGFALAGLLAASQVAFTPAAVYRGGESSASHLAALDPHSVPLIGSPDAPYIVTLLFDYECPHCQQLHSMLEETIQRYDGKLAFVLCPAPLNTHCNPYIPHDVDEFKDSCDLTRIALAVWVANRAAYPAFDRWMYSPEPGQPWRPRSIADAQVKAIALVGAAKFAAAETDPWISQYIQTSVQIFGDTGANAVPKLVFGQRWVTPEPQNEDELLLILHSSLGVPKP